MKRVGIFIYGSISYLIFFGTFLYAVGFLGNFLVPKSIDSEPTAPFFWALMVNLALLSVFALQHSIMARKGFKEFITRYIPKPAERSTYVLLSSLALILMFWLWEPLGGVVWEVENTVGQALLYGAFAFGWLLVLVSTFLINHFDLFGLRQVYLYLKGEEYRPLKFETPGLYKYVSHLVFAVMTTAYILVAIQLEERDLMRIHGDNYRRYRQQVPMLLPRSSAYRHEGTTGKEPAVV